MIASTLDRAAISSGERDMVRDDTGLAKAGGRGV